ncbi:glycosyltransferase family 39 protein [uncultured Chryseobacterium sp.]|uniref:glycosyltransferase family 39 protein n=1 Tax=uncultured Chryseobacterium sp. TaxID=259322 RepID=UPI0026257A48|nr:glycosyltransferase family 39 protein [uncultured Chryseobacterium sp.]
MKSLLITTVLFFGLCGIYILLMLAGTEGHYTYIIDDAYIHLSIAKNFALHQVWGMTPYAFSSSSSAPLFTFLLSVFISLFGNHELIPLFFNAVCSFLIIHFLYQYYSIFFKNNKHRIIASLFTVFFAVLHLQLLIGMEHALHVLVVIVNVLYLYQWMNSGFKDRFSLYWFYFSIALLGLIRFESMFYFVSLVLLFFVIKRYQEIFLTLLFGFVPILLFGCYNYQQAGYFFPNSVVVKGTQFDFSGNYFEQIYIILFKNMLFNVSFYKVGLFPLLMTAVLLIKEYKNKKRFSEIVSDYFFVIVWSLTLILHSLFGDFKGTFRYEAYIMVGFTMALIPKLKNFFAQPFIQFKKDKVSGILILCSFLLLIYKTGYAHKMLVLGSRNIYEQQVQSAKFLNRYYNTSKVVANDIGAICYFSEIHLFDIAGLGSKEMIPFNQNKRVFDDEFENYLENYCEKNKYQLAVVYESWLGNHVPENWKKAAVLQINNKIGVASDRVTIFSIDPDIHDQLKQNIKNFNWNKNVKVEIAEE